MIERKGGEFHGTGYDDLKYGVKDSECLALTTSVETVYRTCLFLKMMRPATSVTICLFLNCLHI